MSSSKETWQKFVDRDDKKSLDKGRMLFQAVTHLSKFGNFITPDGMIELFEDERGGNHQWERFINMNRDVLSWFNGMDSGNKQKFVVNLLFGEGMYSQKIKSNL